MPSSKRTAVIYFALTFLLFIWLPLSKAQTILTQGHGAGADATKPQIPKLLLYRRLFAYVAHMERDRLQNDPSRHVDMAYIEANVQKRINLSDSAWKALVKTSVAVELYTADLSKQAREIANQDKAARQQTGLPQGTPTQGRAALHQLQSELHARVREDIRALQEAIGQEETVSLEHYMSGSFSNSMHFTPITPEQLQARRLKKEHQQ